MILERSSVVTCHTAIRVGFWGDDVAFLGGSLSLTNWRERELVPFEGIVFPPLPHAFTFITN